jgi:hypothetical protein
MDWPYWRFKLAALFAFLSFYPYTLTTAMRGEDAALMWLLFGSPSLIILFLPSRALSVARGLAFGQSLVFGVMTGFILCVAVPVWLVSGAKEFMLPEIVVFFIAQTALFFAAVCIPPQLNGVYYRSSIIAWFTTAVTASSLVLTMMRVEDISQHQMTPYAVYRVVACAEAYADHRNGTYPESLQAMVQAASTWSGPNCIYPFDANGDSENGPVYGRVRYMPVQSAGGRVVGYSILFGPRTFFGNMKTAEYIDQTGIVHKSRNQAIATASDPVTDNVTTSLEEWSQCLAKEKRTLPNMIFPNKLKDMLRSDWPCKPTRDVEGDHLIPDNSYTVYYRSPSEAMPGDPSSFSLQARPNQYAESGVRSYYVDEDGVLRATVKDRPANKKDSPIPACEWDVRTTCHSD